ncbi:unnamed protein product [Somion occarium]|uniref:DUF6699 domain-containing protein n=1 Tax=Somion occarium TaxID=3059160 RepID=A0ABP1CVP8_9APHY
MSSTRSDEAEHTRCYLTKVSPSPPQTPTSETGSRGAQNEVISQHPFESTGTGNIRSSPPAIQEDAPVEDDFGRPSSVLRIRDPTVVTSPHIQDSLPIVSRRVHEDQDPSRISPADDNVEPFIPPPLSPSSTESRSSSPILAPFSPLPSRLAVEDRSHPFSDFADLAPYLRAQEYAVLGMDPITWDVSCHPSSAAWKWPLGDSGFYDPESWLNQTLFERDDTTEVELFYRLPSNFIYSTHHLYDWSWFSVRHFAVRSLDATKPLRVKDLLEAIYEEFQQEVFMNFANDTLYPLTEVQYMGACETSRDRIRNGGYTGGPPNVTVRRVDCLGKINKFAGILYNDTGRLVLQFHG